MKNGKCIIVSAGDFTPVEIKKNEDDFIIACDGGFAYLYQMGIMPDLIVGDFDSLPSMGVEVVQTLQEIMDLDPYRVIKLPKEKDDTDTLYAVRKALSLGYKKLYLYGALGGNRVDHTFANIQVLQFIKHHGATGYIMAHDQMMLIAENEIINFHKGMTGGLSVFSLSPVSKGVTITGTEYQVEDAIITSDFPIGVSNEFIIDEAANIGVREGSLLICVRWNMEDNN